MIRTRALAFRGEPVRLYYRFYDEQGNPFDPVLLSANVSWYDYSIEKLTQVYHTDSFTKESDGIYFIAFTPSQEGIYYDEVIYKDNVTSDITHTMSFFFYVYAPIVVADETTCVVYGTIRSASGEPVSGVTVQAEVLDYPRVLKGYDGPSQVIVSPRVSATTIYGFFKLNLVRNLPYMFYIPGTNFSASLIIPDKPVVDIGEVLTAPTTKISEIGYNVAVSSMHDVVVYYDGMPGGNVSEDSNGDAEHIAETPSPPDNTGDTSDDTTPPPQTEW